MFFTKTCEKMASTVFELQKKLLTNNGGLNLYFSKFTKKIMEQVTKIPYSRNNTDI